MTAACILAASTLFGLDVAAAAQPPHLSALQAAAAPPGFQGVCARYDWACSGGAGTGISEDHVLSLAEDINLQVNREISPTSDTAKYGVGEHWTLPVGRSGDCEDYALLKMKSLIAAGVPPSRLLMALVVGSRAENHLVLVLRTDGGDLVLDNQTNRIKGWNASRYTFLKMQNPDDRQLWDAVLMGPKARRT